MQFYKHFWLKGTVADGSRLKINTKEDHIMKAFDKRIKIGTKVVLENGETQTVTVVHKTRHWINVENYTCSFQVGHIKSFSNKK